jgi:hypothetical protein
MIWLDKEQDLFNLIPYLLCQLQHQPRIKRGCMDSSPS